MKKENSEFGKGFIYNLFLFAKHFERSSKELEVFEKKHKENPELFHKDYWVSVWFNGAGDHFFELEIPKRLRGTEIARRLTKLRDKILKWRLGKPTEADFYNTFQELQDICMEIDRQIFEVASIKADWD